VERRSYLEIAAEILKIATKGARKTHIVYKANLNHAIVKDYLGRLEEQGLIQRELDSGNTLKTTQKGLQFVEQYRNLQVLAHF